MTDEGTPETFGDVLDPVFAQYRQHEDDVTAVWESLADCGVLRDGGASLWWQLELQGGVEEAWTATATPVTKVLLKATLLEFGTCPLVSCVHV